VVLRPRRSAPGRYRPPGGAAPRDEVADLEAAGTRIIQVDEPAVRELLPLRNDCGLRTGGHAETKASLRNLVKAAAAVRKEPGA
jgi:methionine synthase II (cobalamin-independent)